jgi:phenylalanyl-tRNA synthetase beta chain
VAARVDEIHAIEGADRIRRVIVDAGSGPLQIVCGAMNFEVGNYVPLAPVGAVLPGDFAIAERKMKGITSYGMLCSGRELGIGDDHAGLLILDGHVGVGPGVALTDLLGIEQDFIFDISPEGNRPDAWSMLGIARDLASRFDAEVADPASILVVDGGPSTASADIASTDLCGALDVLELSGVRVSDSPRWLQRRLEQAGMRAVNNVVDASNYVMLERGQPTHPYDTALVAGSHIGVRQARNGETLKTLDGTERTLGQPGRGLGDTGVDCVIVDGQDAVIGLAGIMGGESSEIRETTTSVLLELAFFDPMTIARTSKRLGLRSEASHRFERGVHFQGRREAGARFVALLHETCPDLRVVAHHEAHGTLPELPTIVLRSADVVALLGTDIPLDECARYLEAINCTVVRSSDYLEVTVPSSRLDIRDGALGRADLIEEIARLYSYRRLLRRTPTWAAPGGLSTRQQTRRLVRSIALGLGWSEAWTASLISEDDHALTHAGEPVIRVNNPLAAEESIFRSSALVGLVRAWLRNADRGFANEAIFEIGVVAQHPDVALAPRVARGGEAGATTLQLPHEREVVMAVLGRDGDDAQSAVASWSVIADRLALLEVEVRDGLAPLGWHPTRYADLVDVATGAVAGRVGEVDPALLENLASQQFSGRRLGLLELDFSVLVEPTKILRRDVKTPVPSRFPSANFDLALVTPTSVSALRLRSALRAATDIVESVELFDVYQGAGLAADVRSLTYAIRLSREDGTLSEEAILAARTALLEAATQLGATLR